jgi:hypothetical protein
MTDRRIFAENPAWPPTALPLRQRHPLGGAKTAGKTLFEPKFSGGNSVRTLPMGLEGQGLAEQAHPASHRAAVGSRRMCRRKRLASNQGLWHVRSQRLVGMPARALFEYCHSSSARAELCLTATPSESPGLAKLFMVCLVHRALPRHARHCSHLPRCWGLQRLSIRSTRTRPPEILAAGRAAIRRAGIGAASGATRPAGGIGQFGCSRAVWRAPIDQSLVVTAPGRVQIPEWAK